MQLGCPSDFSVQISVQFQTSFRSSDTISNFSFLDLGIDFAPGNLKSSFTGNKPICFR